MIKIIYLDLDGVFADCKKRFKEIIHFEYDVDPDGAWRKLSDVDHLFLSLDPFEYAQDMFNTIQATGIETKMLTALPRSTNKLITAAADKEAWVRKHLSSDIEVICTNGWRGKRAYAQPDAILIDDMKRNIEDWQAGGGIGIQHIAPESTLKELLTLI